MNEQTTTQREPFARTIAKERNVFNRCKLIRKATDFDEFCDIIQAANKDSDQGIDLTLAYINSNYSAAQRTVIRYEEDRFNAERNNVIQQFMDKAAQGEYKPELTRMRELVLSKLTIRATVLYYFATHTAIDPTSADSLTPADEQTICDTARDIDAYHKAHKDDCDTEDTLLQAFIDQTTNDARFEIVYQTITQQWDAERTSDNEPEANTDELTSVLNTLARKYCEYHINDIIPDQQTTIIIDQYTTKDIPFALPDETIVRICKTVADYHAYHESLKSSAVSYFDTMAMFVKDRFSYDKTGNDLTVSDNVTFVSLKDYSFAMTTKLNPRAFISKTNGSLFVDYEYDMKTHEWFIADKTTGERTPIQDSDDKARMIAAAKEADPANSPDLTLLGAFYGLCEKYFDRILMSNGRLTIPIHKLAEALRINTRGDRKTFEDKLAELQTYSGWINGHGRLAVLLLEARDDVTGTITFAVPYLLKLCEVVTVAAQERQQGRRKPLPYVSPHNSLIHASIHAATRNEVAIQIVIRLTNMLLQNPAKPNRGKDGKTPSTVLCRLKFSTIGTDTDLDKRLDAIPSTREKTKYLRDTITTAFTLLRTETDAYHFFENLKLFVVEDVTTSKIDDKRQFTYETKKQRKYATKTVNGKIEDNLLKPTAKPTPKANDEATTPKKRKSNPNRYCYNRIAPTYGEYQSGKILWLEYKSKQPDWEARQADDYIAVYEDNPNRVRE